jgi:hypothetical protein
MTSFKDEEKGNYKEAIKLKLKENSFILEDSDFNSILKFKQASN